MYNMAISSGDTAWLLASTALVMLMTPGVGFFYGGLVRRKNLVSMITLSLVAFALVSLQWVLFGYSLVFGHDIGGLIGGPDFLGLSGVGQGAAVIAGTEMTVPSLAYMMFQLVFATVTLAIVTSVFAERVKLSSFIIFGLLWTTLVYDPLAHWVWGGGWLANLGSLIGLTGGALDFAGGTVVHISAGFSALAIALVIRKRAGFGTDWTASLDLGFRYAMGDWRGLKNFTWAVTLNGFGKSWIPSPFTPTVGAAFDAFTITGKDGKPDPLTLRLFADAGFPVLPT